MFFITTSSLWSFLYFFILTYSVFIFSILIYLLPIQARFTHLPSSSTKTKFSYINSFDLIPVLLTPLFILCLVTLLWSSSVVTAWFGHIIYTPFQSKIFYLLTFTFSLTLIVLSTTSYYSSQEIYDFLISNYSFYYWMFLLFTTNSIFTVIFGIEVLSTLIFLLIITSSYSTNHFYRNLDFSFGNYKQQVFPYTHLQSLLFFFWMSLITSLSLFIFLLYFYTKVLSFDWFLLEYIFQYIISTQSLTSIMSLGLTWFVFTVCVFLKCGVAPLYIWKPTFFKGLPMGLLFFYICFFYFFLFVYLINLLVINFSSIFYYFIFIQIVFIFVGLLFLLAILCETFYIKSFLAVSSILNSLFVFLAISNSHTIDFLLWI